MLSPISASLVLLSQTKACPGKVPQSGCLPKGCQVVPEGVTATSNPGFCGVSIKVITKVMEINLCFARVSLLLIFPLPDVFPGEGFLQLYPRLGRVQPGVSNQGANLFLVLQAPKHRHKPSGTHCSAGASLHPQEQPQHCTAFLLSPWNFKAGAALQHTSTIICLIKSPSASRSYFGLTLYSCL